MKSEFMKCYTGNLDGMRTGLVIAHNQKEAAKIAKMSLYHFRMFWVAQTDWPKQKIKPLTLYTKSNNLLDKESYQEGVCKL